ncbi:MAG: LPXTG cell wall anchor domain-containing protein, partial [Clostridia bacterium]|nr:LPXTG cell wall anchor domain-containing protein [Clostridia bacterium]
FKVVNQKGFKLPFTGEFGNWALAISGILLVAVGGTVIVLVNRKKKDSPTDNEK